MRGTLEKEGVLSSKAELRDIDTHLSCGELQKRRVLHRQYQNYTTSADQLAGNRSNKVLHRRTPWDGYMLDNAGLAALSNIGGH